MKRFAILLFALTLYVGVNAEKGIHRNNSRQEIEANTKEILEQKKDSIMYSKLSANQILELKKGEQDVKRQQIENEAKSDMPLNGFGIVLICSLPFLFVGFIIVAKFRNTNAESKRRHELYIKSLEMGQNIPDHFFEEPKKVNTSSNLKKGIIALSVGIALIVYFTIVNYDIALIGGIIPAFVGIGYLLVHFLENNKTDAAINKDEQ